MQFVFKQRNKKHGYIAGKTLKQLKTFKNYHTFFALGFGRGENSNILC